jgi:hypothetical protein
MEFTSEERNEISAAVERAVDPLRACSFCGQPAGWSVSDDGFVMLSLHTDLQVFAVASRPALPCVAVTCQQCGNTELLNAFVLGLGHIVERRSALERAASE